MTLPPWRRSRPVGTIDKSGNVYLNSDFWRQFEAVTEVVNDSDGSSPGGVDAVTFAAYQSSGSPASTATALASYGQETTRAATASYSQAESRSVSASYAPACGGATLARY